MSFKLIKQLACICEFSDLYQNYILILNPYFSLFMLDKQVAVTPTPPSKSTVTSTTKACFLSESYYDYYDVRQGPPATAPAARYDYSCGV